MRQGPPHLFVVIVAASTFPASSAVAEPTQHPIHYTWSATVTPSVIRADNPSYGSFTFLPLSGAREVNTGEYHWFEIAKAQTQVDVWQSQISFAYQPLQFQLTLHDTASGVEGVIAFEGMISGSLYPYGQPSWPSYRYALFHVNYSTWVQEVVLGEHRYRVGIERNSMVQEGFYGELPGLTVGIMPEWVNAPVTPEPSALCLLSLGGAALGAEWVRRARRRSPRLRTRHSGRLPC